MDQYAQAVLLSAFEEELEKLAYMYMGAMHPDDDHLASGRIPYKKRRKALEHYAKQKAREKPTTMGAALGGGAALFGGMGALAGAGIDIDRPGRGGIAGAVLGALAGAGLGALAREADKGEIKLMRRVLKDADALDRVMQQRVAGSERRRRMSDEFKRDARHHELVSAIRTRT